jgi:hypothetical protein
VRIDASPQEAALERRVAQAHARAMEDAEKERRVGGAAEAEHDAQVERRERRKTVDKLVEEERKSRVAGEGK